MIGAYLSAKSYADAVNFLREHATILDYSTLGKKEQQVLNVASPGILQGVSTLSAPYLMLFISLIIARFLGPRLLPGWMHG